MKESSYKRYDELPLFLNAATVAKVLGVSPSSGYELMHVVVTNSVSLAPPQAAGLAHFVAPPLPTQTLCVCAGSPFFPVLKIGSRLVVPRGVGVAAHSERCRLKYTPWLKCDPIKNYFQLPKEIFLLGLSPGALAVYSYLLCCENRNTYQCWPSYKTIGRAVKMSANTVRKYVCELEERQLISTESTTVTTKAGLKRNGNLLYTIRPIQLALDQFYDQQLAQMSVAAERQRVAEALALHGNECSSA